MVERKDSLSEILFRFGIGPIYGKKNALEKILALNLKSASEGDNLLPGEVIYLPLNKDGEPLIFISKKESAKEVGLEVIPKIIKTPLSRNEEVLHFVSIAADYKFIDLNAADKSNNASAKLSTKEALGLALGLHQKWSETFQSYFYFSLDKLSFAPSSNSQKKISGTEITRKNFSLGLNHQLHKNFILGYQLSYGDELFVRGLNSQSIMIDSRAIPKIGLRGAATIFQKGRTSLSLDGKVSYLASGKSDAFIINSGHTLGLDGVMIYQKNNGPSYEFRLGYETRSQSSSVTDQKENTVRAQLSYFFSGFGEK